MVDELHKKPNMKSCTIISVGYFDKCRKKSQDSTFLSDYILQWGMLILCLRVVNVDEDVGNSHHKRGLLDMACIPMVTK